MPIDGRDATAVLRGESGARSPHDAFYFYYHQGELQAVRSDQWKLILPHRVEAQAGGRDGGRGVYRFYQAGLELYDLSTDPGEKVNVASVRPEILTRLLLHAEAARQELGDALTKRVGAGVREPGRLP
jgi:arylsulfatase